MKCPKNVLLLYLLSRDLVEIDRMLKGKNNILSKPKRGLILYDFTTSDPVYTKKLARRAASKGVSYMDAGMTGGGAQGADEGYHDLDDWRRS